MRSSSLRVDTASVPRSLPTCHFVPSPSVCVGSYPELVAMPCTNMCQECSVYQPSGRLTPQSREAPLKDKSFHRCHPPERWNAPPRYSFCGHIPMQNECHWPLQGIAEPPTVRSHTHTELRSHTYAEPMSLAIAACGHIPMQN